MEYKPKLRRVGLNMPFGYYVSPFDDKVLLPDPKKLDALNYAFRMKAKYKTPIRSCTGWLHAATGTLITPAGFMYAYKRWIKDIRVQHGKKIMKEVHSKIREKEKLIQETYKDFGVVINDGDNITALAEGQVQQKWKKKEQGARQAT